MLWVLDDLADGRHLNRGEEGVSQAEGHHWNECLPASNLTFCGDVTQYAVVDMDEEQKGDREE